MKLRMVLEGAEALEANLRELPRQLARNTLRRALLKAAQPMADEARRLLPSMAAWKNEYVVAGYRLSARQQAQAPKPQRMAGQPVEVFVYVGVKPKRHLHLLEFGTGPRYTKTGAYRGMMQADPFMRPAFDQTTTLVLEDFGRTLGREIEATASRLAKRNAKRG